MVHPRGGRAPQRPPPGSASDNSRDTNNSVVACQICNIFSRYVNFSVKKSLHSAPFFIFKEALFE